jgi:phosphoribosylaminoimidazolecarboxamide formyltransferase/IMP cyclohydrolase
MVVCNLYQFKEAITKPNISLGKALEMIDIGGPSLLRAGAKNFPDVIVVPHSKYYSQIIKELKENDGKITDKTRAMLAQDVFAIMADYNAAIASYLQNYYNPEIKLSNQIIKIYEKVQDCRYGENWEQAAAFYRDTSSKYGLHNFEQLGGKQISFNNYLDIDSCVQMLLDFDQDHHVTAILKHTSPNGLALDKKNQLKSVQMAFNCDPMSAFGGIWGVNKEIEIR